MAGYKIPCIHCNTMIDSEARMCIGCGSSNPFGYSCPVCLKEVQKGQMQCDGCFSPLYVNCPHCMKMTFVEERCEHCKAGLMVRCENQRCNAMQFFTNTKCTACGKKMKPKVRR